MFTPVWFTGEGIGTLGILTCPGILGMLLGIPGTDGTPGKLLILGILGIDGTPGILGIDGTPGGILGIDGTAGILLIVGLPGINGIPGIPWLLVEEEFGLAKN